MNKRTYSRVDNLLIQLQRGLTTLGASPVGGRESPAAGVTGADLTASEKKLSAELMRVNHAGEICAQALYYGQMAMAKDPVIQETLAKAAEEETDHLAWTEQRLKELNSHTSYLNFFWYSQSFLIGMAAGLAGDGLSLGFVEETERQVTQHLEGHLHRLPEKDLKSRKIVAQMRKDEQRHGQAAARAGAKPLPELLKLLMSFQAKILTCVAAKV